MEKKEYTKEDLTVTWQSEKCSHSTKCAQGLSNVFNPKARPWINMDAASKDAIIAQVKLCPSGALSYRMQEEKANLATEETTMNIDVNPTGPLIVTGDFTIKHTDGTVETRTGRTTLCRCGESQNKPFCDGSHKKIDFQG